MKISKHIVMRLIVPLSVGMFIIGFYTVLSMFSNIPGWTQTIQVAMKNEELQTLERRSKDRASLASNTFLQIKNDVKLLRDYAREIWNDELPIVQPYQSYFGVSTVDSSLPPGGLNSGGFNYHSSVWYKNGVTDVTNSHINEPFLNDTSIMDNVLRSLFKSNPGYAGLYIGTEDSLFRHFPYLNLDHYPSFVYTCATTGLQVTGYDPTCRGWYKQANDNPTEVIFTGPYNDAGTGEVLISAAHEVSPTVGVVSVDVSMNSLDQQVAATTVLQNGYAYIVDDQGYAIVYPDLERDVLYKIEDLEFTDRSSKVEFSATLQDMLAGNSAVTTFMKGEDIWHISYNDITGTPYHLALVVPDKDLNAASDKMQLASESIMGWGTAIVTLVFLAGIATAVYANNKISNRVVRPIKELDRLIKSMTNANLDVELGNQAPVSSEINVIFGNFRNLLMTIRFGNQAYYKGDNQKALQNYQDAKKMMEKLKNKRGEGICDNNIGATLKQIEGRMDEAVKHLEESIKNAGDLEKEQTDKDKQEAFKIVRANRLMNLAVLYKDQDDPTPAERQRAEKLFNESLDLHRATDNMRGIAEVSGNFGQFAIQLGHTDQAIPLIQDAWDTVMKRQDPISMQFAAMNMGILRKAQGLITEQGEKKKELFGNSKTRDAIQWFAYALDCSPELNVYVKYTCLNNLEELYRLHGENDTADAVKELGGSSGSGPKDVMFVLDVSGSMAGGFIRQCRESIKIILQDYINDPDYAALIKFDHEVTPVFDLMQRKSHLSEMLHSVDTRTETRGMTAFYDAVLFAIRRFNEIKNNRKNFIIALTDGEDNKSKYNSAEECIDLLKNNDITLIAITVGSIRNVGTIKSMCQAATDGMHIEAQGGVEGIRDAFGQVAKLIVGQAHIETL